MKKSAFLLLVTAFISTLFSACVEINIEATATTQTDSNAASGSTLTGQLSDSYIQGLNYIATPSGLNGVTDAFGSFRFQPGDVVTFSLGPITLPELRANQDEIFYDLFFHDIGEKIEENETTPEFCSLSQIHFFSMVCSPLFSR